MIILMHIFELNELEHMEIEKKFWQVRMEEQLESFYLQIVSSYQ
jgi:hypothetical protein